MTLSIRKASTDGVNLKGYYLGQINERTVCCCKGKKATLANLEYLSKTLTPRAIAALTKNA